MSDSRKSMVSKVFYTYVDPERSGAVSAFAVKSKFNPREHPDVISGKRTEDDVLLDFLETFDAFLELSSASAKQEVVTLKVFRDYYAFVSFLFEDDKEFKAQVEGPWMPGAALTEAAKAERAEAKPVCYLGLDKLSYKKGRSNKSSEVNMLYACAKEEKEKKEKDRVSNTMRLGASAVSSIRKTLTDRGTKGLLSLLSITKEFKELDTEKSGHILVEDFVNVLRQYQIVLDEVTKKCILNAYDKYDDGLMSVNSFLATLINSLSPARKALVDELFDNLDSTESKRLHKDHIVNCYNPVNHPLVKARKIKRDAAILDLQAALNKYLEISGGEHEFELEQFEDFFRYVSASCEEEEDFEAVARRCWDYPEKVKEYQPLKLKPPFDTSDEPTNYVTTKEELSLKKVEEPAKRVNIAKIVNKLKHGIREKGVRGVFALQKSLKVRHAVRIGFVLDTA